MSEDRTAATPADGDDLDLLDDELGLEPDEELTESPVDGGEVEPVEPELPTRQPSRMDRRIAALREREKVKDEEIRRLREVAFTQTTAPRHQVPQLSPDEERARDLQEASQLPFEQQQAFLLQRSEQRTERRLMRQQLEMADMLDRTRFDALKESNPHMARLAPQVEQQLIAARQQNMNPTREALYYYTLGQEVHAKAKTQTRQQQQRGARRVASQTTQPGAQRSTAAAPRREPGRDDSMEALEARLKSVTVGDFFGQQDL